MAQQNQADRNPARLLTALYFLVNTVLLLNVLNEVRHLWRGQQTMGNVFALGVAIALLALGVMSRIQAGTRRDR
jgi:hypothetical protein